VAAGYVYVLINRAMPDLVKIGRTEVCPEQRAIEISSTTGVPTPFTVAFDQLVCDCAAAERELHGLLSESRVNNNREFFNVPLRKAIKLILQVAAKYPFVGEFNPRASGAAVVPDPLIAVIHDERGKLYYKCPRCAMVFTDFMSGGTKSTHVTCPKCLNPARVGV
jgi:hypothetical protein